MLKSDEILEMLNLSENLSVEEKGFLAIAVTSYRSMGKIVSLTGNERVSDLFNIVIRPLIDKEKENTARIKNVRAAAGSTGGKSKAKKESVAKGSSKAKKESVAKDSNKANLANVANANFVNPSIKASETLLDKGFTAMDHYQANLKSNSSSLVDGGDNNIYNTTTKNINVTTIGGGGSLKENTTTITVTHPKIVNSDDQKRKSDSPAGAGLKLKEKTNLGCEDINDTIVYGNDIDENNLSTESFSEKQLASYKLLCDNGVWPEAARECAMKYDNERIQKNVKLKKKEAQMGSKINNFPAVVLKAIRDDQAGYGMKRSQRKNRPISKEEMDVLNNLGGGYCE